MRLATFSRQAGPELGAVEGDFIVPLAGLLQNLPTQMTGLAADWSRWAAPLAEAIGAGAAIPLAGVELLAPIARPGKILAIGLNYADHIAESGLEAPKQQVWFCKQPTSVTGPFAPVEIPKVSNKIDYEVELVAIIGKGGRHITQEQAAEHVFGYCVGNDVSTRDWQLETPQWMLGKSFDTHAPYGPFITTADEIRDPHELAIKCLVNGQIVQSSSTKYLVFNVWDQIAHVSKAVTLETGDLIFTGTPGGVGAAAKPPRYLKAGDTVRCEIEGLGAIENKFENEG